jgi:septal ring factor EnvC (AmiA/AmiB activator)
MLHSLNCRLLFRRCEERSDAAIQSSFKVGLALIAQRSKQRGYYGVFSLLLLLHTLNLHAAESTKSQTKQLQQINKQIQSTQSQLTQDQRSAVALADALKKSELAISSSSNHISQLTQQIKPKQQTLTSLQSKGGELQKKLSIQQSALTILLRTAYENRQSTVIKLLLNEENASQFNRMNTYYQYYSGAQLTLIKSIQTTLLELNATQKKIGTQVLELSQLRNKQVSGQKQLQKSLQERQGVMSKIQGHIKTTQEKLNQLIENKKALENLVTRLGRQEFINDTRFGLLKKRLPWPTQGSLGRRFGSRQNPQSLPEQGVFIRAEMGGDIRAIAPGKVIYAEWLKGFGLLMILDHGKGYMSLYSHCNTLNNKVGDIVSAGALIATVGNSGGFQETGTAFEIRYNGRPLDPHQWCKGNP